MSVQLQASQVIDKPVAKVFHFIAHEHVRNIKQLIESEVDYTQPNK